MGEWNAIAMHASAARATTTTTTMVGCYGCRWLHATTARRTCRTVWITRARRERERLIVIIILPSLARFAAYHISPARDDRLPSLFARASSNACAFLLLLLLLPFFPSPRPRRPRRDCPLDVPVGRSLSTQQDRVRSFRGCPPTG